LPDVDQVVRELRQLRGSGLTLAVSIGKVVLERIYRGDVGRWRSRGRKDTSFRKLARHAAVPFSAPTLSRSVGIYVVSLRRRDLLEIPHVGPSHVRELLGLSSDMQDRLIDKAADQKWSVRRLRQEVGCLALPSPPTPGEKRASRALARRLRRLKRDTRAVLRAVGQVDALEFRQAEEFLGTGSVLNGLTEMVVKRLGERAARFQAAGGGDAAADSAP
jgi:hypothetical protein